eukprot:COSAG05_NODE_13488_length_428_cov_0.768997_1_plen_88_part_10
MNVTAINVLIVDDDIADLVIICADGYNDTVGNPVSIDEDFIGAYDAAGPVPVILGNRSRTSAQQVPRADPCARIDLSHGNAKSMCEST